MEKVSFMDICKLLMIFTLLILVSSCATTSQLCNVSEAKNSVVCELSSKLKTTPEMISQSLQIANFGALEGDLYTAQQANDFINRMIEDIKEVQSLGKEVSYLDMVNYINRKFDLLSPRIQAVFVLINPAGLAGQSITIPLTDYDFELLLRHLYKQKNLIKVYL